MLFNCAIETPDGTPMSQVPVELYVFGKDGETGAWTWMIGATGATDGNGKLSLNTDYSANEFPACRLVVQGRVVLETILQARSETTELGTMVMFSEPLFHVGDVDFYGINKAVFDGITKRVTSSARHGADAPVETVLQTTANQMAAARDALIQRGLSVSNLSMEMKVLMPTPGTLKLLGEGDLPGIEAQQLSTIRFQLDPLSTAASEPKDAVVPTVVGYTEAIARRKLAAAGLAMIVSHQIVPDPGSGPSSVGRVVKQDRAPGADAPRGAAVTVFLGKLAD